MKDIILWWNEKGDKEKIVKDGYDYFLIQKKKKKKLPTIVSVCDAYTKICNKNDGMIRIEDYSELKKIFEKKYNDKRCKNGTMH